MQLVSKSSFDNDSWISNLSIGDSLDVRDKSQNTYIGKWMRGNIVDICYLYLENQQLKPTEFKIHYIGWDSRWDETIDITNEQQKKRIAPLYSKYPDWREKLQKNLFVDVNIVEYSDFYKQNKVVCDKCEGSGHSFSCAMRNSFIDFKNIWQIGRILHKNKNSLLIQVLPGHLCINGLCFNNPHNLFVCKNINSEHIMPVNTHSKNYCRESFCNGCSVIHRISIFRLKHNIKKYISEYFKFHDWKVDQKVCEDHCYICFEKYDDENVKPLYFQCGHNICFDCFQEKTKRKLYDLMSSRTEYEKTIECDYCKKNIFKKLKKTKRKVHILSTEEIKDITYNGNHFMRTILQSNYHNNKYYKISTFGYKKSDDIDKDNDVDKGDQYLCVIQLESPIQIDDLICNKDLSEYINCLLCSTKKKYVEFEEIITNGRPVSEHFKL